MHRSDMEQSGRNWYDLIGGYREAVEIVVHSDFPSHVGPQIDVNKLPRTGTSVVFDALSNSNCASGSSFKLFLVGKLQLIKLEADYLLAAKKFDNILDEGVANELKQIAMECLVTIVSTLSYGQQEVLALIVSSILELLIDLHRNGYEIEHHVDDFIEALFLLDWEQSLSWHILHNLIPLIENPFIADNFKLKLNNAAAHIAHLSISSFTDCMKVLQALLRRRILTSHEIYQWFNQAFLLGEKSFFKSLLSIMTKLEFSVLTNSMLLYTEVYLQRVLDKTSHEDKGLMPASNEILPVLIMTTCCSVRFISPGNNISINLLLSNTSHYKYATQTVRRLLLFYLFDSKDLSTDFDSKAWEGRLIFLHEQLVMAEIVDVFKYLLLNILSSFLTEISNSELKADAAESRHYANMKVLWQYLIIKFDVKGMEIIRLASITQTKSKNLDIMLDTLFHTLSATSNQTYSLLGSICRWARGVDSSGLVHVRNHLCRKIVIDKTSVSLDFLQFLLYELSRNNDSYIRIECDQMLALLGYLSSTNTDKSYQQQWLEELPLTSMTSCQLVPTSFILPYLSSPCSLQLIKLFQYLVTPYYAKKLKDNFHVHTEHRLIVSKLISKRKQRHHVSGYKEELRQQIAEHWEGILFIIGSLSLNKDAMKKDFIAFIGRKIDDSNAEPEAATNDVVNITNFNELAPLFKLLDAAWDIVDPCPFTATELKEIEPSLHFVIKCQILTGLIKLILTMNASSHHLGTASYSVLSALSSLFYGNLVALRCCTKEITKLPSLRQYSIEHTISTKLDSSDSSTENLNEKEDMNEKKAFLSINSIVLSLDSAVDGLVGSVAYVLFDNKSSIKSLFHSINASSKHKVSTIMEIISYYRDEEDSLVKKIVQSLLSVILISVNELSLSIEHICLFDNSMLDIGSSSYPMDLIQRKHHGIDFQSDVIAEKCYSVFHGLHAIYTSTTSHAVISALNDSLQDDAGLFTHYQYENAKDGCMSGGGEASELSEGEDSFLSSPAFNLTSLTSITKHRSNSVDNAIKSNHHAVKNYLSKLDSIISANRSYLSVEHLKSSEKPYDNIKTMLIELRCEFFRTMNLLGSYLLKKCYQEEHEKFMLTVLKYYVEEFYRGCEQGITFEEFMGLLELLNGFYGLIESYSLTDKTLYSKDLIEVVAKLVGSVQFITSRPDEVHIVLHLACRLCPIKSISNLCYYLSEAARITKLKGDDSDSDNDSESSEMEVEKESSPFALVLVDDILFGIEQCHTIEAVRDLNVTVVYSNKVIADIILCEIVKSLLEILDSIYKNEDRNDDKQDYYSMSISKLFLSEITQLFVEESGHIMLNRYDQKTSSFIVQTLNKFLTHCLYESVQVISSNSQHITSILRGILSPYDEEGLVTVSRIPSLYTLVSESFHETIAKYFDWARNVYSKFLKSNQEKLESLDKKLLLLSNKLDQTIRVLKNKKLDRLPEFSLFLDSAENMVQTIHATGMKSNSRQKQALRRNSSSEALELPLARKRKSSKKVTLDAKRLRSPNRVIDKWLDEDDIDDAFIDLEEFLVDDDDVVI